MTRYEIVEIIGGVARGLLDTHEKKAAQRLYRKCHADKQHVRLRIDGETLPIYKADEIMILNVNATKANTGQPRPRNKVIDAGAEECNGKQVPKS